MAAAHGALALVTHAYTELRGFDPHRTDSALQFLADLSDGRASLRMLLQGPHIRRGPLATGNSLLLLRRLCALQLTHSKSVEPRC